MKFGTRQKNRQAEERRETCGEEGRVKSLRHRALAIARSTLDHLRHFCRRHWKMAAAKRRRAARAETRKARPAFCRNIVEKDEKDRCHAQWMDWRGLGPGAGRRLACRRWRSRTGKESAERGRRGGGQRRSRRGQEVGRSGQARCGGKDSGAGGRASPRQAE